VTVVMHISATARRHRERAPWGARWAVDGYRGGGRVTRPRTAYVGLRLSAWLWAQFMCRAHLVSYCNLTHIKTGETEHVWVSRS